MPHGSAADWIVDLGHSSNFSAQSATGASLGTEAPQGARVTAPVFSAVPGGNHRFGETHITVAEPCALAAHGREKYEYGRARTSDA
jgi:hypothetical protein